VGQIPLPSPIAVLEKTDCCRLLPSPPPSRRLAPMTPAAAFFDLDGTLLTVNSGRLWMQRERRVGRITRMQMAQAVFYLALYRFGMVDVDRAMRKALTTVKGLPEQTVRQWTREWFVDEVVRFAAPGGKAAIEGHRKQGHALVLLTSSSPYESEAATEHFGLDAFLCTRYEVKDGVFTGELVPPVCYGEGKIAHAERFASERGIDMKQSYYYGDSITDLPILLKVGNPRVVNPDPRLKREAKKRGWEILSWAEAKG
jgi:HAD superfamily hydrolase (TIGR01490 family)